MGKLDKTGYHSCFYFSTKNVLKKKPHIIFCATATFIEEHKKHIFFFLILGTVKKKYLPNSRTSFLAYLGWTKRDRGYNVQTFMQTS